MNISIIVHDIRSCHNVGSILRSADGFGITHVYLTGYTPYPESESDTRLPHIRKKLHQQIHKTALGAEKTIAWTYHQDITQLLNELHEQETDIVALEQTVDSTPLPLYRPARDTAILLGREVEGIEPELLNLVDATCEIPMSGHKESFNVSVSAAIAMYQFILISKY